jgi:hypothetical protein
VPLDPEEVQLKQEELRLRGEETAANRALKQEELRLKGEEIAVARGKGVSFSPAQATVLVAVIGLLGAAAGAVITGVVNILTEFQKEGAAVAQAQHEFEYRVILKAIDAPSRDAQASNLQFVLAAGIIHDPEGKIARLPLLFLPGPIETKSTSSATTTPSPASISTLVDVDLKGGDYDSRFVISLSYCQQLCLADSKCKAYTFVPSDFKVRYPNWTGPVSQCFLKDRIPAQTRQPGLISGQRNGQTE